jgi:large subunit ribosomal protein L34e
MVEGKFKSGRLARVHKRMPGGKTKLTFQRRLPGTQRCAECKIELKGIPRLNIAHAKNTPKSKKTVERAFGGFLCPACLKAKLKAEIRLIK